MRRLTKRSHPRVGQRLAIFIISSILFFDKTSSLEVWSNKAWTPGSFLNYKGSWEPIPEIFVLQQNGSAVDSIEVTVALRKKEVVARYRLFDFDTSIVTNYSIVQIDEFQNQYSNLTITFEFEENVGTTNFTLEVETSRGTKDQISGVYTVGGVTFKDSNGTLVSGFTSTFEAGKYEEFLVGPKTLFVDFVTPDSTTAAEAVMNVEISFSEMTGEWQNELMYSASCASNSVDESGRLPSMCSLGFMESGDELKIQLVPYRVGYGTFFIHFYFPNLRDPSTGDPLEQVIPVVLDMSSIPPPAFFASEIWADFFGGEEMSLEGYNMASPPLATGVGITGGQLSLLPSAAQWKLNAATTGIGIRPGIPDQTVYFETVPNPGVDTSYNGSVIVSLNDRPVQSVIVASTSFTSSQIRIYYHSSALARDFLMDLASSYYSDPDYTIVETSLELVQYDLQTFSQYKANQTCFALLAVVNSSNSKACTIKGLFEPVPSPTRIQREMANRQNADGIVIISRLALPKNETDSKLSALTVSAEDGSLARMISVPMSSISLYRAPQVVSESLTPSPTIPSREAGGQGLAGWIIGLIAVLVALLVLAILGCVLFVMYKKGNDSATESDISSEGFAVVPRPDDDLYQQAIVRDGFGRGSLTEEMRTRNFETEEGIPAEYPQYAS